MRLIVLILFVISILYLVGVVFYAIADCNSVWDVDKNYNAKKVPNKNLNTTLKIVYGLIVFFVIFAAIKFPHLFM